MRNHNPPGYLIPDSRFPGDPFKRVLHEDGSLGDYAPPPIIPSERNERDSHEQDTNRA